MIASGDPAFFVLILPVFLVLTFIQHKMRLWLHGWSLISKKYGYFERFDGVRVGSKVIYAKSPSSLWGAWRLAVIDISVNEKYIFFNPKFPYSRMMSPVMFPHDSIKVECDEDYNGDVYVSFLELKKADFYMYGKDYDAIQEKIFNCSS